MKVAWKAVFIGYCVDYFLSLLLSLFVPESFAQMPDMSRLDDLLLVGLFTFTTGIGGYVAGRIAGVDRVINGLLVGVVGILVAQLLRILVGAEDAIPHVFVISNAVGCLLAALGGYLSRFPARSLRPR